VTWPILARHALRPRKPSGEHLRRYRATSGNCDYPHNGRAKMGNDNLCTIIAVGLITLLVTVMVLREGSFTILNPSVAAERWELLMRQLRR
jgi:hypothetical protein